MSAGPVNLLNPDLGIQSIMDTSKADRLPDARPLASSPLREAGLEELLNSKNTHFFPCQRTSRQADVTWTCSFDGAKLRN